MLYSWKQGLPSEHKIAGAYEMLKKEGKKENKWIFYEPTCNEGSRKRVMF